MYAAACGGGTTVTELGGPETVRCQVTLSADPRTVTADGGSATVSVDAARDCTWQASTEAPWAALSTTSGQGAGTIGVTLGSNQQPTARTAGIIVNNQRVDIAQDARPCRFTLASTGVEVGDAGRSISLAVATAAGCSWRATSPVAWIQISDATQSGPGSIDLHVAPNPGAPRTAVVTVAGESFTVTQFAAGTAAPIAPNCTPVVQPPAIDVSAAATTETFRLEVAAGCAWTAASHAAWLTIASEAAGQGAATVRVAVAQNTGVARTGTVAIAGQQVTVRQAAPTPAAPSCTYALDAPSRSFSASGGDGSVEVTTRDGCAWTAASDAAWVTVTRASGTGTGEARYRVQANASTDSRSATVTIAGRTHRVTQAGAAAPCTFSLNPAAASIGAAGGGGRFSVVTAAGCAWSATGAPGWVAITAGSGTGPGDVVYTVQPNQAAEPRTAAIAVGNQSHTITQAAAAPSCSYALNPPAQSIAAAGGEGRFSVATQAGCAWSPASGAPWVTLTSGSGPGPGEVAYSVQANPATEPRSTTITVAGQAHTLTQAAAAPACTYALNPVSSSMPAAGGEGRFSVVTQAGCGWTASGGTAWLTISSGAGAGPGDVVFNVQPNSVAEMRSTTISVGGQSHTVSQAAAAPVCTYSLNPTSGSMPAAGGEGRFSVATQAGCAWSASTGGAAWMSVTAGGAGSGPGEVVYTVQANTAPQVRTGAITVGGQSHSVTQAAAAPVCTYSLNPSSFNAAAGGGEGRFTVVTQAGCSWSVSGGADWITIGTPLGAGQGDVVYTVQANTAPEQRSASILVSGQAHTVMQAGAAATPPPAP